MGPPGLGRERRLIGEPAFDGRGVSEYQRRLQRCGGDARMEREQPVRAARSATSGAPDDFDGGVERQRAGFDLLAQRVPRWEPVFTRDGRLRVVQRQVEPAIASIDLPASAGKIANRPSASRSRARTRRAATWPASSVVRDLDGRAVRGRHTTSML